MLLASAPCESLSWQYGIRNTSRGLSPCLTDIYIYIYLCCGCEVVVIMSWSPFDAAIQEAVLYRYRTEQ